MYSLSALAKCFPYLKFTPVAAQASDFLGAKLFGAFASGLTGVAGDPLFPRTESQGRRQCSDRLSSGLWVALIKWNWRGSLRELRSMRRGKAGLEVISEGWSKRKKESGSARASPDHGKKGRRRPASHRRPRNRTQPRRTVRPQYTTEFTLPTIDSTAAASESPLRLQCECFWRRQADLPTNHGAVTGRTTASCWLHTQRCVRMACVLDKSTMACLRRSVAVRERPTRRTFAGGRSG